MKNDKAVTVLKFLLQGGEVKHPDGNTYLFSEDNELCVRGVKISGDTREDVWLKVNFGDLSLKDFITWARNIPDDDVFIMGANIVLNEVHHGKDRRTNV